jgi:hypothetical protein
VEINFNRGMHRAIAHLNENRCGPVIEPNWPAVGQSLSLPVTDHSRRGLFGRVVSAKQNQRIMVTVIVGVLGVGRL